MNIQKKLLTTRDAALCLSVTEYAIRKWTKQGKIIPIKIGRCLRYKPSEIEYILENGLR